MAHWCQFFDANQDPTWTGGAASAEAQQAAAAAAAQGSLPGDGPPVLVTSMQQEGDWSHEGGFKWEGDLELAAEGGHQEPGRQQQQLPEELTHEAEAVAQPLPRLPRTQNRFLPWQVEELERVFQETHYPEAFTISLLAGLIEVTEARVKSWFNNRRVKYRKSVREMSLGAAPPGFQPHDFVARSRPTAMPSFLSHLIRDGVFPEPQTPGPPELPMPPIYP